MTVRLSDSVSPWQSTPTDNFPGKTFGSLFLRLQPVVAWTGVRRQTIMTMGACAHRTSSLHYEQERESTDGGEEGREGEGEGKGSGI